MRKRNKVLSYMVIVVIAVLAAVSYELFVFPNKFAPAGINGICTMVQYVTGISVGYLSLFINVPLAILVYLKVSRSMAVRSMIYVLTFSLAILFLDNADLSRFAYDTANGNSLILGPLAAGIVMGFCYYALTKAGAYTGGMDYISSLIHKVYPQKSMFSLIFMLTTCVAVASYFVYDYQMEPVLLCILYSFASTTVGDHFRKADRSAVRFEIITAYPDEIGKEIITHFKHSATKLSGIGMYTGTEKSIITCVVNRSQVRKLCDILAEYPQTFAMMSPVNQVVGNFKDISGGGHLVKPILDEGDSGK